MRAKIIAINCNINGKNNQNKNIMKILTNNDNISIDYSYNYNCNNQLTNSQNGSMMYLEKRNNQEVAYDHFNTINRFQF